METALPEDRLARRLTLTDAVVIGLGAMIGAGIFAAPGPAAEAAGSLLSIGLALAGIVAYANATSSAQLAAVYPESGGTNVYARERLGPYWGFLAGWGFVIGKTASLAAMALTMGSYAYPDLAKPIAISAVVVLTAVNYRGVQKTEPGSSLPAGRCQQDYGEEGRSPALPRRRPPHLPNTAPRRVGLRRTRNRHRRGGRPSRRHRIQFVRGADLLRPYECRLVDPPGRPTAMAALANGHRVVGVHRPRSHATARGCARRNLLLAVGSLVWLVRAWK